VRMLLPREIDEKGEEIDPRAELVKALLEYKKYKEMSEELTFLESDQRKLNYRGNFSADEKESPPDYEILLKNVSIYDLAKAYKKIIEGIQQPPVHEIAKINVTIDEQIKYILEKVELAGKLHFLELVIEMKEKIRIVVTFVALLELVKMGKIGITVSKNFNDFYLVRLSNG